jgi:UDP-N-acetylglucosamine 4,6-dehydratase
MRDDVLNGMSVLVTGGTGSFGRAFVRRALAVNPRRVIVFSRSELTQQDMRETFPDEEPLRYFVGDVRDPDRLHRAFRDVDVVIHAAAMKNVPACEFDPFEAVLTNVLGSKNVIDAAINNKTKRVVFLSTDKAPNAATLYGATKFCAERMTVHANSYAAGTDTVLAATRYGNVFGSQGSVVPIWREQMRTGKWITITDPLMTRFFMTLDQSVDLVLIALERMKGGEVFVPKISSTRMARLASAVCGPDQQQRITGIRPGEKLHECLIGPDESYLARDQGDVYCIYPPFDWVGEREGEVLPPGFTYTSDDNPNGELSVEDLRGMAT